MDKPTYSTSARHVKCKAVEKLSGAAGRKIHRDDTRMADAKTCQKITAFISLTPVSSTHASEHQQEAKINVKDYPELSPEQPVPDEPNKNPEDKMNEDDEVHEAVAPEVEEQVHVGVTIHKLLFPESDFPTDSGLFTDKCLGPQLILKLCEHGSYQPGLKEPFKFLADQFGRKFRLSWYTKTIGIANCKEDQDQDVV